MIQQLYIRLMDEIAKVQAELLQERIANMHISGFDALSIHERKELLAQTLHSAFIEVFEVTLSSYAPNLLITYGELEID